MPGSTEPAQAPPDRIVWIDLEMTGLDPRVDRIIEIATIVTDGGLEVIAEGPCLAVRQPEALLATMDEWNRTHHAESGLLARVRGEGLPEGEAEARTLAFLHEHCTPGQAPLAGNSVWQDRRFLTRAMPGVDAFLHYRLIDVSTVKELARRWYPAELAAAPPKVGNHRALDDIRESIAELRYYRAALFR